MRRNRLIIVLGMAFVAMSTIAWGQSSPYGAMSVVGDFQGDWNPNPGNMRLISNNTWRTTLFMSEMVSNRYKFAANESWTPQWGETNQSTPYTVPITGIAEVVVGNGNDIVHRPVAAGFYTFTFNDSTRAYHIERTPIYGTNVLRNTGFEFQGRTNTFAFAWDWDRPDQHGSTWGNVSRESWRAHSGSWEAAIKGRWAGADNGGWWQDGEVYEGLTYEASAWFWADSGGNLWTAREQSIAIEFYARDYGSALAVTSVQIQGIGQVWTQKSVRGVAPVGAAWGGWSLQPAGQDGTAHCSSMMWNSVRYRSVLRVSTTGPRTRTPRTTCVTTG